MVGPTVAITPVGELGLVMGDTPKSEASKRQVQLKPELSQLQSCPQGAPRHGQMLCFLDDLPGGCHREGCPRRGGCYEL
jgi:hypothetical protein